MSLTKNKKAISQFINSFNETVIHLFKNTVGIVRIEKI